MERALACRAGGRGFDSRGPCNAAMKAFIQMKGCSGSLVAIPPNRHSDSKSVQCISVQLS